ncbi:hypothetical protein BN131_1465 [Cronobacter malonaticus 681]|nr:hypothetical protein BN131_1464 [Cronobacter malonaticus 681]CCJ93792.1 hypothetical protein BN131_1465 [Cronobacter malonaticus 681]
MSIFTLDVALALLPAPSVAVTTIGVCPGGKVCSCEAGIVTLQPPSVPAVVV